VLSDTTRASFWVGRFTALLTLLTDTSHGDRVWIMKNDTATAELLGPRPHPSQIS